MYSSIQIAIERGVTFPPCGHPFVTSPVSTTALLSVGAFHHPLVDNSPPIGGCLSPRAAIRDRGLEQHLPLPLQIQGAAA